MPEGLSAVDAEGAASGTKFGRAGGERDGEHGGCEVEGVEWSGLADDEGA